VLDALADVLPAVEYVGFVHGGESLVAPGFFDVLAAIARARRSRTDVHLLTNGMLLDDECVHRLIDGGVTSLAVSLDGLSAATNDALRVGSRAGVVIDHLRNALTVRRALGADLRIGVSWVVTAENVSELPALGRLAVDLGLDWLKIEEMFPATPAARRSLLAPRHARVEEAMVALRHALGGSPVVLVDHRDPPGGCLCGDDSARAFREADDFANRAHFVPCRLPWEQACIDPDGVVRLVDYDHPPLGNLLEQPLLELWNGEVARQIRAAATRRCRAPLRRSGASLCIPRHQTGGGR
jgi:MoaA/NifB/PqqE/SkfB family radical SAM enzyme